MSTQRPSSRPSTPPGSLADRLANLGWTSHFEQQLTPRDAGFSVARVASAQRERLTVIAPALAEEPLVAHLPAGYLQAEAHDRPTVGDWVLVTPAVAGGPTVVARLLQRHGALARQRPGERHPHAQLIAANLDVVWVAAALDVALNPRRIERYLVAVRESGAAPWVVLTKADMATESALVEARQVVTRIAGDAPIEAVSAVDGRGLGCILELVGPGTTVAVIGPSGAGKSTLVNALIGVDCQRVQEVRDDGKGRHTTTHRELFAIASGGWLIDTPGMRELGLWCESGQRGQGIAATFADIDALAITCRYRDCCHQGEPGCAVQAAIDAGELDPARVASQNKLLREMARLEVRTHVKEAREQRARQRAFTQRVERIIRHHPKRKGRGG